MNALDGKRDLPRDGSGLDGFLRSPVAWPARKVAAECEGGTWGASDGKKSRHTTGEGYRGDCEKYNQAQISGWIVLRFTVDQIRSGYAAMTVAIALGGPG